MSCYERLTFDYMDGFLFLLPTVHARLQRAAVEDQYEYLSSFSKSSTISADPDTRITSSDVKPSGSKAALTSKPAFVCKPY